MNFYNGKYIYRFLTNLTINELKSFEKNVDNTNIAKTNFSWF